jgi:hypothetical protein
MVGVMMVIDKSMKLVESDMGIHLYAIRCSTVL